MMQSPRDITGDFNGRDELIPAVYSTASLADQIPALPDEESINAILGARSAAAQHILSCMCSCMPYVGCPNPHYSHQRLSIGCKVRVEKEASRRSERCPHSLTKGMRMQDSLPLRNDQRPHCSLGHKLLG